MINILMLLLPRSLRDRLRREDGLLKILDNILWLLFDFGFRLGVSFVVLAWLARHLGPADFGIYSYATAFISLLTAVAALGLRNIVVRDLVDDPARGDEIMGTTYFLRLIGGGLAILLSAALVSWINPGDANATTRIMVMIMSLEFLFMPLDVVDLWFQAKVQSRHTVIARNAASTAANLVRIAMILADASLVSFAWITFAGVAMEELALLAAYALTGNSPLKWRVRLPLARRLLSDSWPLILFGLAVVVYMRIDLVMIGHFMDNASVGIYSASARLSAVWFFIPSAVVPSVFPAIVRARKVDRRIYIARLQLLYDLLALVTISVGVAVVSFAGHIVTLVYGAKYAAAAPVLALHVWVGLLVSLGAASQKFLLAENLIKVTFLRTVFGCGTNVVLNAILIPRMGMTGAAVATLVSYSASVFSIALHPAAREQTVMMLKSTCLLGLLPYLRHVLNEWRTATRHNDTK